MRRREFIALAGSAAIAAPAARAQPSRKRPIVGFLATESAAAFAGRLIAFREGLKEAGFVEGETVEIESGGTPRYIFKLSQATAREPLSRLLARATSGLDLRRDKRPMRGA